MPAGRPFASTRRFLAAVWRRAKEESRFVGASAVVSTGFGLARLLGFLFSVSTSRILGPDEFGEMSYALTVASIAGIFVTTAPTGLARFLSRSEQSAGDRDAYYSNWLIVAAGILGLSALGSIPGARFMGLSPWMVAGVVVNLAGMAILGMFREVERGLNRFTLFCVYYVLANILQLVAVLLLAGIGHGSGELFVIIYGASSIIALPLTSALTPIGVRLKPAAIEWRRIRAVARFIRPVLLQSIFWNVWFFSDVVMVQKFLGPVAVGNYSAAKAIANGFGILPSGIVYVLVPKLARLDEHEVKTQLGKALLLTAIVTAPIAAGVVAFSGPVVTALFGQRYPDAAAPAIVLVIAMLIYGFKTVFGALWLGLGHPVVETVSAGVAMATTVFAGLFLVPTYGLLGAATAFLLGTVVQLVFIVGVTVWALAGTKPRVRQLGDQSILGATPQGPVVGGGGERIDA
jgi:O-antigen/teichoic acid export membrane protein